MRVVVVGPVSRRQMLMFPERHTGSGAGREVAIPGMEASKEGEMTTTVGTPEPNGIPGRPVDLRRDGLLWLINRQVFCPRGYALARDPKTGEFFLLGNGTEPYVMGGDGSDERPMLDRVRRVMP